jgi:hypothetical protein
MVARHSRADVLSPHGGNEDDMTKRWSSTKSLDGQTKRQASKSGRRELAAELQRLADAEPAATFDNVDDLMKWLDSDDD